MNTNDFVLRGARTQGLREGLPATLLLAPFLIAFLLFFLIPAGVTFWMSLTESSLTRTNAFIGLANYATLVSDPSFWDSVLNTFYFALLTVVPLTALGLLMALLVNHFVKAQAWLQGVFFLPFVLPISVGSSTTSSAASGPGWRTRTGRCRRWRSAPCGGRWASTCCCSWRACATSRPTCTRRPRWTARAA
jgi:ABC-type Fe3+ transport system permease subunit